MKSHVRNLSGASFSGKIVYELFDKEGKRVFSKERPFVVRDGKAGESSCEVTVRHPHLWSPDSPYLYRLHVYVKERSGRVVDGYCQRIGIRSIELRGKTVSAGTVLLILILLSGLTDIRFCRDRQCFA